MHGLADLQLRAPRLEVLDLCKEDLKNQRNALHIAACFNVDPELIEAWAFENHCVDGRSW